MVQPAEQLVLARGKIDRLLRYHAGTNSST
jgi:hypothetical protein